MLCKYRDIENKREKQFLRRYAQINKNKKTKIRYKGSHVKG